MDEMNQNLPEEMELAPQEEQNFFEETEVLTEEAPVEEEVVAEEPVAEPATVVVEEVVLPKRPGSPAAARFITILLAIIVLAAGVFFNKDVFAELVPALEGFLNSLPTVVLPELTLPF